MSDIFISYSSQDRARVRDLATALQAEGWSVWWDRDIKAGQTFDQVIETALDSAKCVVVLWSKSSISSEWVKNEAASAAERGVLVPALIDEVRPPLEFRRKQTATLVGWNHDRSHPGFRELCDGIAAAGLPAAPPLKESGARRQVGFRWDCGTVLGSIAVIALALAGGGYLALHGDRKAVKGSQSEPATPANAVEPSFATGVFDFKWPGNTDCWEIYRGPAKVTSGCGASKQALQSGTYTIKPASSGIFVPFNIIVNPNTVTSADAMGGIFDFQWPGNTDCWEIDRGEVKVTGGCGAVKQALQSGTYTVKPTGGSGIFLPFSVAVKTNAVTSADAMGGIFDFQWPGNTDCWEIDRGEMKVTGGCGAVKQALQSGTYTVKPTGGSGIFLPFSVAVKSHAVTSADATGGVLDFHWPGSDCWGIYRGEVQVTGGCGSIKQALQAGAYVIKPINSPVFAPVSFHVTRKQTVTVP